MAVEVKQKPDTVKPHQRIMHDALIRCGIPTYVTYGANNLHHRGRALFSRTINGEVHARLNELAEENSALVKENKKLRKMLGMQYTRTPYGVHVQSFNLDFEGVLELPEPKPKIIQLKPKGED